MAVLLTLYSFAAYAAGAFRLLTENAEHILTETGEFLTKE